MAQVRLLLQLLGRADEPLELREEALFQRRNKRRRLPRAEPAATRAPFVIL